MKRVAIWLVAFCAAASVAQDAPDRKPAAHPLFSHTQRFAATGLPSGQALAVVQWAEDVCERLERFAGEKIPFPRGEVVEFRVATNLEENRGSHVRAQGGGEGRLIQRLDIRNIQYVDQEDLLESLTWLLLNRVAKGSERRGGIMKVPETPDWLSVGVAQNLYPEQRSRNNVLVERMLAEGRPLKASDLIRREALPQGRWEEKPQCGHLLAYAATLHKKDGWLRPVLPMHGKAVAPGDVLAWFGASSPFALDEAWVAWSRARTSSTVDTSGSPLTAAKVLEAAKIVRPATLLGAQGKGTEIPPGPMPFVDLVAYREESWIKPLCAKISMELTRIAAGREPSFARVVAGYSTFLQALAEGHGGLLGGALSEGRLRELLADAEREESAWVARNKDLKAHLDAWSGDLPPAAPSSEVKAYMDEAESRLETPPTD